MQTLDERQRFKIDRPDFDIAIGAVRRNFDLGYAVHSLPRSTDPAGSSGPLLYRTLWVAYENQFK